MSASHNAPVTSSEQGRVWSQVFRRSRISPHVFVVAGAAADEVDQVVAGLGLPQAITNSLFDNAHWATPLLDGAVTRLLTYGLPALPSGTRVYGHRPLRLLCHLMDLHPPTRALTGERHVPDIDQLLAHLDQQRQTEPEVLLVRARTAVANDAQEVTPAVGLATATPGELV
ncbi:hypothetical protein [Micromonospora sp. CA-244673]|uniref:hypothetical protein n=1 Tax=Micromonospora sp. CA-244673 TaxID=3239958 RepID=UPI003D922835